MKNPYWEGKNHRQVKFRDISIKGTVKEQKPSSLIGSCQRRIGDHYLDRETSRQVVLVTGGSAGIGRASAMLFAREGAHVVIAARNVAKGKLVVREIKAGGRECCVHFGGRLPTRASHNLVRRTVDLHGRLDCAFNNAAAIGKLGPTADLQISDFDTEVSANLRSVWLCMRYGIEQVIHQEPREGAIVNTSSMNGLGGAASGALYSMSKAGILALTKAAAQEYAGQGIRVKCTRRRGL
jgi:NAD(P)-dependent dehydrogenase (short-subunit alcohol dehydrogenase family)